MYPSKLYTCIVKCNCVHVVLSVLIKLIILVYGKEIDKRKRSIIKINFSFSTITVEKPGSLILFHPNYIIS